MRKLRFCIITLFVLATAEDAFGARKWEQIINQSGVKVYRRDDPNSDMVEFKGQGVVKAAVPKLIALLQDVKLMPLWVEGCREAKELERNFTAKSFDMDINEYRMVIYGANKVPWPLSDRDYVLKGRIKYSAKRDAAIVNLHNVKHKKMPKRSGLVRMPMMKTRVTLIPRNNDKWTWIQLYVHVDPGGYIPAWAVNFITKSVPLKSIKKLRKLSRRSKYDKGIEKLVLHHVTKLRRKEKKPAGNSAAPAPNTRTALADSGKKSANGNGNIANKKRKKKKKKKKKK